MRALPSIRIRRRWALPLCGLLLASCEDTPVQSPRTIALVQPLSMTWPGRDQGDPYVGGPAVFQAASALRVTWKFRIEATPSGALYKREFASQDFINFSWDGHHNFGFVDFARGDSCTARVSYDQLDPAEGDRARFVFRIGD